MKRRDVQELARRIGEQAATPVDLDHGLAPHLSTRVGGSAAAFLRPPDGDALVAVVLGLRREGVPVHLLGGGSNLVAEDGELDFAVVHVPSAAGAIEVEDRFVRAPASATLAAVLRASLKAGLHGLEWAAGLPGSLGGAVVGNAGAFGGDTGESVQEVELLGTEGERRRHVAGPADFGYRRSFVAPGELVLGAVLELEPADPAAVRDEVARVNARRAGSQPKGGHSCGCMFKNPDGDSAGRLIDACGLKGLRRGGARVSEVHANFVVNDGEATASDLLGLVEDVRESVQARAGVILEPEIHVWRARAGSATESDACREATS